MNVVPQYQMVNEFTTFSLVRYGVSEVIVPVAANRAEETLGFCCGKVGMVPLKTD